MGEHLRTASVFVSYPEVVAQYGCKPNGGFCNLKATGARVNLTAANVILLCDPWWTPGAEAQAQLSLLNAHTMQLPFLAALRSELFAIGYTNALGHRAPFLDCSGGAGGSSVYISLLVLEWPPADGLRGAGA